MIQNLNACVGEFLLNQFLQLQFWGLRREGLQKKEIAENEWFHWEGPSCFASHSGVSSKLGGKNHPPLWVWEIKADIPPGCLGGRMAHPSNNHGVGK